MPTTGGSRPRAPAGQGVAGSGGSNQWGWATTGVFGSTPDTHWPYRAVAQHTGPRGAGGRSLGGRSVVGLMIFWLFLFFVFFSKLGGSAWGWGFYAGADFGQRTAARPQTTRPKVVLEGSMESGKNASVCRRSTSALRLSDHALSKKLCFSVPREVCLSL